MTAEAGSISVSQSRVAVRKAPPPLTHAALPLWVGPVAGMALAREAILSVNAVPVATDVPVQPAFVSLCSVIKAGRGVGQWVG